MIEILRAKFNFFANVQKNKKKHSDPVNLQSIFLAL